jgi:hypothetical protein
LKIRDKEDSTYEKPNLHRIVKKSRGKKKGKNKKKVVLKTNKINNNFLL